MNGLGLGSFDANGATAWREVTLPTHVDGDTVQVDVAVANVADGLFDSQVMVDFVEEQTLAVTVLTLRDIDNATLSYLSAASHTYFSGNTRVHGTITIEGEESEQLQSLVLEVVQGGAVVATGDLTSAMQSQLLNQEFGADKKIEITAAQHLFNISSGQLGGIDDSQNGTLLLRVKATAVDGDTDTRDSGSVELLTRYTGANRYGQRDPNRGGDDWVKPSVDEVLDHFAGSVTYGDMSNMNAGSFAPDHQGHGNGQEVDGWFAGYNSRNAATATTMIDLLNDASYGSRIRTVYVTFQRTSTNAFWNAIQNVTLADGRAAKDVIRVESGTRPISIGTFNKRIRRGSRQRPDATLFRTT